MLGAVLGMVAIWHTWGRQLQHHPHLHFIIPGGGLRVDGLRWVPTRQPDWLLPMPAVAAAFRRGLEEALRAHAPDLHAQVPDAVWPVGVAHLPKGTHLGHLTHADCDRIAAKLNARPRQRLGFRTPHEIYYGSVRRTRR